MQKWSCFQSFLCYVTILASTPKRIFTRNILSRKTSILNIDFTEIHTSTNRIKCYCVSDLHSDTEKNQQWVGENCLRNVEDSDVFTVIILPGDIGSEIDRLESVFRILTANYDAVVYVPGNHEAWRRGIAAGGSATSPENRAENRMATDSITKLVEVMDKAKELGVHIGPIRIEIENTDRLSKSAAVSLQGESRRTTTIEMASPSVDSVSRKSKTNQGVVIFPLYSWYHSSWDTEPELLHPDVLDVEEAMPFTRKWGDYSMCSWPETLLSQSDFCSTRNDNTVLAEAFSAINEPFLNPRKAILPGGTNKKSDEQESIFPGDVNHQNPEFNKPDSRSPIVKINDTVISFSHFLPRQELCPEKRFLLEPLLPKVIGSNFLESQIRRLMPDLHLFGHTHIPIDMELEGIRYIQWPKGYSRYIAIDFIHFQFIQSSFISYNIQFFFIVRSDYLIREHKSNESPFSHVSFF